MRSLGRGGTGVLLVVVLSSLALAGCDYGYEHGEPPIDEAAEPDEVEVERSELSLGELPGLQTMTPVTKTSPGWTALANVRVNALVEYYTIDPSECDCQYACSMCAEANSCGHDSLAAKFCELCSSCQEQCEASRAGD